jgi:hypothetical protein
VNSLYIRKLEFSSFPEGQLTFYGHGTRTYVGGFITTAPPWDTDPTSTYNTVTIPNLVDPTSDQMDGWGTTGYNRAKPGKSPAGLGQFFYELNRVPTPPFVPLKATSGSPIQAIKDHVSDYRNLGKEYLNVQFGWFPFLRDVLRWVEAQERMAEHLAQLRRDNNRWVKRTATVLADNPDDTVLTGSSWGVSPYPVLWSEIYTGAPIPTYRTTYKKEGRIWFVGRFKYYIPDISTPQWERRARRKLNGLDLTPQLLWEVMPWSWLIDWFTNVGDLISNMSENAAENLVVDGACVMHHYLRTATYETFRYGGHAGQPKNVLISAKSTRVVETKARAPATPFGFGLKSADLSTKQASILAALGMTTQFY